MYAEPFKIIGYHLPTFNNKNITKLSENNQRIMELEKNHKILDNDPKQLITQSLENEFLTKSIEKRGKTSRVMTLSLCIIGGITIVCKWRNKKNRGLEIEIRKRTRKNIE